MALIAESPLRLLHVEDSEDDAILILEELATAGFSVSTQRVETAEALEAALRQGHWDLAISDFHLPRFGALAALKLIQQHRPALPCIVVSGAIGEEAAVELMKAGASDFVMKQGMSRLVPAIERSLREVEAWKAREAAVEAMHESEARFKAIAAHLPGVVFQSILYPDGNADHAFISDGCRAVLGVDAGTLITDPGLLLDLVSPADRESFVRLHIESANLLTSRNWEGRILIGPEREMKWVNLRASARRLPSGVVLSEGIITNVTESRLAQESLRISRERLRQLASHVEKVREEERAHMARDIHDDLGGTLTAAKIDLAWIHDRLPADADRLRKKSTSLNGLLDAAIEATRRLARRLRPLVLDHGIAAAVDWQAREFSKRTGIACEFACPAEDIQLGSELSTALFRVFQETLTNVTRHSGASHVGVELVADANSVTLVVRDNGCGMSEDAVNKDGSYGLRGMRERVDFLGGSLSISSQPGQGTQIEAHLPVRAPQTIECGSRETATNDAP